MKNMTHYHFFADDSQLYKGINPNSITDQLEGRKQLENGIELVGRWMNKNKLKLNKSKTEFIMIGTKSQLQKMSFAEINISGENIQNKEHVRNLGCIFDNELKMKNHVHHILKSGYYQLRQLRVIRKCLTKDSAKTLVVSLIFSRFDYCNALLYGISEDLLDKLQLLQHACARFITGKRKFDHISETLKSLHWLPVRSRIKYKIILWVFKCITHQAPEYLQELIVFRNSKCSTRSSKVPTLEIPRSRQKYAGDRAFSVAGPTLWNSLPVYLRREESIGIFKKKLKTHLFIEHYGPDDASIV